tara:strand:+ start:106 stop:417 length:312 start_codon:yes stop_codon:yes gene_type:complete
MNKSLVFKNKFYLFFSFIFVFFLFLYLMYFLINGQRGIISYFKLKKINTIYSKELNNLEYQNIALEDKIRRLQPNTLDLDYLEERLRKNIGLLKNNEITVVFD